MINQKLGRLLVVDDESELMNTLCETLSGRGYQTAGFTSGHEALETLKVQEFDLLLADLMMPGMDGIGLLRAAMDLDPHLVGIIMTGQGTVRTAVEAMKTGAFDYVLKPFKLQALLPVLDRAMEVRNLRLDNVQLRQTVAIYELTTAIAYTLDVTTLLNKTADAALQQMDADEVSIMLPISDGNELYVAAVRGESRETILGERMPIEQGIAGWVARHREPLTLMGEVNDPRFAPLYPRLDIGAAISVPMLVGGKLVGILNVSSKQPRMRFSLGHMKALSILTSTAGVALEGASLFRQAQQAEEKYRSIFENVSEGIFQTTLDGRFITANPALARILGYASPAELIATVTDIGRQLHIEPERRVEMIRQLQEKDRVLGFECQLRRKDGGAIWISKNVYAVRDEQGSLLYYGGTLEDITERKLATDALRESEERYRTLVGTSPDAIMLTDLDTTVLMCNQSTADVLGYEKPEDLRGEHALRFLSPEERQDASIKLGSFLETGIVRNIEQTLLKKDGSRFPVEISASVIRDIRGEPSAIIALGRDITERKRSEDELRRLRRDWEDIFRSIGGPAMILDRDHRVIDANNATVNMIGKPLEELVGKHCYEVAHGTDRPVEHCPLARTLSSKQQESQEIDFSGHGDMFLASCTPVFDETGEVEKVIHIATDISKLKKAEQALEQSVTNLERTLEGTIQAMALTVEMRDPYTAGHQRRVAQLATAIAEEMSLPSEQIKAINMASVIHDIGKIYVPAEILSKPGLLNEMEFCMIRSHCQTGYDILKTIEFPCPIAEIVYQHHERFDGSGYPSGLSGEGILVESRIIGVADVVEAMASHRPYRPACGIEKALEEISAKKGVLYDPTVVDACFRVFEKGVFKFVFV